MSLHHSRRPYTQSKRRHSEDDQRPAAKREHRQQESKVKQAQAQAQKMSRKATAGPRTCGEREGSVSVGARRERSREGGRGGKQRHKLDLLINDKL